MIYIACLYACCFASHAQIMLAFLLARATAALFAPLLFFKLMIHLCVGFSKSLAL